MALAAPGFAQVVSYDGTAFPDDVGWIRYDQPLEFLAGRYLSAGCLVQVPEIVEGDPANQQDFYQWNLAEQAGASAWYLEWVMETNGPLATEAVAPAPIVASGFSGIQYHFTVGADELVLNRDSGFPLVFHSFAPGLHDCRLEVVNDFNPGCYAFYFDGELIDSGEAEGIYPTADSVVVFGARAAIVGNVTRWDRIEFGPFIPEPIPGDSDGDGDVDLADYTFFEQCHSVSGPGVAPAEPGCLTSCDMDEDGDVDAAEFGMFQMAFTGSK
jgi:hypothetical protein